MKAEEITKKLCARIGARYHPPLEPGAPWGAKARRLEWIGDRTRGEKGLIDYLMVRRSGNFGNNYIQLAHALAVAEAHGIKRVAHNFPYFGEARLIGGARLIKRRTRMQGKKAGLRGAYFLRQNIDCLQALTPERFNRLSEQYLRPALRLSAPAPQPGVAALNLRGGADVFDNPNPNPNYGQPPLSYYQTALNHLAERHEIKTINIVYQDVRNPVLEALTDWLQGSGADWRLTSEGPEGDAAALLSAEHIVMGWTTFTAALALLSDAAQTVTIFRKVQLQNELAAALPHLYLIEDRAGGYIPADGWIGSTEQRAMMRDYPAEALALSDIAVQGDGVEERRAGRRLRRAGRFTRLKNRLGL